MSVLLLGPIWLASALGGAFEIPFILLYIAILPRGLRWLWQPVAVELIMHIGDSAEDEPAPGHKSIADRISPTRW